jgi:hypothetical protein
MACPFFRPVREMEWGSGRAPLGGIFEGQCERQGVADAKLCNFGYARGSCAVFPESADADATRFSVAGSSDGIMRVVWILERNHAPIQHGVFEYQESSGEFLETPQGTLGIQARVFAENYLRRRL